MTKTWNPKNNFRFFLIFIFQFNRATTSQLIKWFSNFREFFYIQVSTNSMDYYGPWLIIHSRLSYHPTVTPLYNILFRLKNMLVKHFLKEFKIQLILESIEIPICSKHWTITTIKPTNLRLLFVACLGISYENVLMEFTHFPLKLTWWRIKSVLHNIVIT